MTKRGLAPIYFVVMIMGAFIGAANAKCPGQPREVCFSDEEERIEDAAIQKWQNRILNVQHGPSQVGRVFILPANPPARGQYLDYCPGKPEELCWTGPPDDKEEPTIPSFWAGPPGMTLRGHSEVPTPKPEPDPAYIKRDKPDGCSMVYPSRSVPSEPCY